MFDRVGSIIRKTLVLLLVLICDVIISQAQTDSSDVESVSAPYSDKIVTWYDSSLQTAIASYNYSNTWDFDGDAKNDSLVFVGTGGAHAFYFLRIVLTSDNRLHEFSFIEIDMPYISALTDLKREGDNPAIQFVVHDFDADGIDEIYLNCCGPGSLIPEQLKKMGITSSRILIDCSPGKLVIKNFEN